MQILVLGMHRSGTSMVARLLNMTGAYFDPEGVENASASRESKEFLGAPGEFKAWIQQGGEYSTTHSAEDRARPTVKLSVRPASK
jgi:hypothetical protein